MKKISFLIALLLLFSNAIFAQMGINTDNSAPDPSAMLDVKSTTKGLLIPRMTLTERDAISNPATGLLIFCTSNNQYYSNKGSPSTPNWMMVSSQWLTTGSDIYFTGGKVGLGITNPVYLLDISGDINYSGTLRKNGIPVVMGISGVTATLPLISSDGQNPNISISQATSLADGFLSHTDWGTFNAKQNALTFGNISSGDIAITGGNGAVIGSGTVLTINKGSLTESGSSVLTITGGSGALLGTGATIQVKQANAGQSGYLSSADWSSFNSKVSSQWVTNGQNISYNSGKVGIGTSTPALSAILEVASTNSGVLLPRMTVSQRTSISSPATGLLVYQTDAPAGFYFFNGTKWVGLTDLGSISGCLDYDGNAYPTFMIGTQEWMGENLRVTHYRDGTAIPDVTDNTLWGSLITGAYCWYNNDQSVNAKYGILYNWYAVNDSRKLCPAGWHVPSDAEWTTLTTYLGGESIAAGKMKSVSALWISPNTDATNNSGFSGFPGGYCNTTGSFNYLGYYGYWWSATEDNGTYAWYRNLIYVNSYVGRNYLYKAYGFSVRCVRD
jgi:uncharacterized protein (TIGR02145 family)